MESSLSRIFALLLDREYQREIFQDLPGFQRKGTGYIACCPFHEDTLPTMVIYNDRPEYFCFACSRRGDWIHYLMERKGLSFHDVMTRLAMASELDIQACDETQWGQDLLRSKTLESLMGFFITGLWSPQGEEVLHYLYARGYATGEVKGMGLGYYPGHEETLRSLHAADRTRQDGTSFSGPQGLNRKVGPGLVVPFRDASGRLMGIVHRDITGNGPESYTPLTSMEGLDDVPFLLYRSRGQKDIIVVEGFFDALLLDQIRMMPVMGVGSGGMTEGKLNTAEACGCRHFILALGNGERRKASAQTTVGLIQEHNLAASILPIPGKYTDIDEFIRMTCLDHYKALLKKTIPAGKWLAEHPS